MSYLKSLFFNGGGREVLSWHDKNTVVLQHKHCSCMNFWQTPAHWLSTCHLTTRWMSQKKGKHVSENILIRINFTKVEIKFYIQTAPRQYRKRKSREVYSTRICMTDFHSCVDWRWQQQRTSLRRTWTWTWRLLPSVILSHSSALLLMQPVEVF